MQPVCRTTLHSRCQACPSQQVPKLILESVTQPRRQHLVWDEMRVIHTIALDGRPDVRPRNRPRRRVRQKDTDKAIAMTHVVQGADVLMRTDTPAGIDLISSSEAGRRRVKPQHGLGAKSLGLDPIAATRFGYVRTLSLQTHRAQGGCAERLPQCSHAIGLKPL